MKCPNCGKNIPDDKMYCESCGAEIQIVPEIEFEDLHIENEMKQALTDITTSEFAKEYDIDFDDDPNIFSFLLGKKRSGKAFYFVLAFVLVLIIIAAVFLGRSISKQNSYEYQIALAEEKIASNNISGAITCYENAFKIKHDPDILFTIANLYYTMGRDNDAIFTLSEITSGEFTKQEIEEAYEKIISLYLATDNYTMVANFLRDCTNETILNRYEDFCVYTPEFNVKEGTYTETVTVKLSAPGTGKIYYTLDGSIPSDRSDVFTTPIFLEYGSYTVSAVYINEYGVASDIVKAKYLIDVDFVFEPVILTEAGTYNTATLIEAEVPVLYTLYYTTDGTDPSKDSTRYVAPIPMKEGETTYRFIMYASDGTQSTIVEKTYNLELEAEYTPAEAVTALVEYMISVGYINQDGCHKEGIEDKFLFMYSAIYPIEEMGNYYFVVEYMEDSEGNRTNTGNIFAVGCSDLSVYKVSSSGGGDYVLFGF